MSLFLAYRGFNYVSYYNGGYENADSLADLAASGANAAGLNLEYGINVNNSTVYADANYTDSLTALGNTITEATSLGLTVMVKPLVDFLDPSKIGSNSVGDWRAYYNPANPAAFFASYKSMIVAEAQVAQAHGATLLSLGTELDQLTGPQYLSYWTDIISSVRAVFSGKLTYSADWNDDTSPWQGHNGLTAGTGHLATQVSFWNQLDYVGLDVYAPISDAASPTLANLIAGWTQVPTAPESHAVTGNQSLISYFESLAAQTGKPLLFTEIGYESATDAASQPAGSSTNVFDPSLQANLYAAFFDAWKGSGDSSLNGVFFWNWDPNTAEVGPGNGANFSPQGLPAAAVVTAGFNDAVRPVAHNDAFSVAGNATLTGHNVFADNGSGADSGSGFAVTAVDGFAGAVNTEITLSSGATLTLNADGTFVYDTNHAFDSLAPGTIESDGFNYTITGGSSATAIVTVTGTPPPHLTGTAGDDTFTALPGNERIDAGAGTDSIIFNFKLTDAVITFSGNQVIVNGPSGSHTVLTGFEVYQFTDGAVNDNDGNPLVDDLYYYSQYHDVWNAHADADQHYAQNGWHEYRNPDAFFDTAFYLAVNADVKAAGLDPLAHFDQNGWKEGRQPSMAFDDAGYLSTNPDVKAAGVDPLAHFLASGEQEGRQPFALTSLIAANGFDYVYYLQHNPDVAAAHVDPFQHFETNGWKEVRNPNALFDTGGYLATYADVAAAGVNPLDHYHRSGWKEGRDPSVNFDTTDYLSHDPDVASAHIDPLLHYLQSGIHEGRLPFADGVWG